MGGSATIYEIDQELSRHRHEIEDIADKHAEDRQFVRWLGVMLVLSNLAWATTCLLLLTR